MSVGRIYGRRIIENRKNLNMIQDFSDRTIANILYIEKQAQAQYAQLYWNGVKMENNRGFTKTDRELVDILCKEVDRLTSFQNKMMEQALKIQRTAEEISVELKKEGEKDENRQKQIGYLFRVANAEIDNLRRMYELYHQEQVCFAQAVNNVTEFLKERIPPKKNTIYGKLRKLVMKRRNR